MFAIRITKLLTPESKQAQAGVSYWSLPTHPLRPITSLWSLVYIYYLAISDTVITTVTCKSHVNDAAIVDGAAAAKAAAGKVGKHRDLVLAGNPDNRFVPFAVEEGGRLGTDAEALVDVMVRAGSADPTTWCATKTYCMRTLAVTTAKGIA